MSLHFPPEAICMIPGCKRKPTHQLSLRMRRKDTGADWAPNIPAYLCVQHATYGGEVQIFYTPNSTGNVSIEISAATRRARRLVPISRREGVKIA